MESIYYVLCWHCHRRCKHCYEDRFRPYVRDELREVVAEAQRNAPRIIRNLPDRLTYKVPVTAPTADGPLFETFPGRIILSGGDVLTDPVREPVLYPTLEAIRHKYRAQGGVAVIVQTTGDLVTPAIIDELLARDVTHISIAGIDEFHVGLQGEKQQALIESLTGMFRRAGVQPANPGASRAERNDPKARVYSMFGATEGSWIGKIWPRGRAWDNDLSRAGIGDNFCAAWSGGLDFLNHGYAGSEVSIDPTGSVYPCCLKTAHPLGNLTEEPLLDILDDLAGNPALEAINAGKPERMGLQYGWDVERFYAASRTTTPGGRPYANLCIGCDRFHEDVLGPVLAAAARARRARRLQLLASDG